jgi:hypothetical protein
MPSWLKMEVGLNYSRDLSVRVCGSGVCMDSRTAELGR